MKILTNLPAVDKALDDYSIRNAICIETDGILVFSGWTGIDLETGEITDTAIDAHANDAIDVYEHVLKSLGLSLDNVISVRAFLKNPVEDFPAWNEVFKARFQPPYPCRTTVGAQLVAGQIELEFMASRTSRSAATPFDPS